MPKLLYHGHSCFELIMEEQRIIVDPFLSGNPHAEVGPAAIEVAAVLVSHGHGDHVGDAVEIAKRNDCVVVTNHEIATWLEKQGVKVHGMHIGGAWSFQWGRVKLVPAIHGSMLPDGSCGGLAAGFLFEMGGKTIYYAGDTALHSDMALYGRLYPIDLALLPIGDNYTMGIDDAIEAAVLCNANEIVPIHYDTFPVIGARPADFAQRAKKRGVKVRLVQFGEMIDV